jgi:hypothetical protein
VQYQNKTSAQKHWDDSTEAKMLSAAVSQQIDPRFRPVLIYRYRGSARPAFTAVGTWFQGKNGPLVATAEHLMTKQFADERLIIRFLCPDEHQITNGIESIVYRGGDAGIPLNTDMVFLRPGNPGQLEWFSDRRADRPNNIKVSLTHEFKVGDKIIRSLKSLVTGKEYPVVGATRDPQYIVIDYKSEAGESGTGFIDEYGQFYILDGGTKEGEHIVTFLSGPLANPEKHL